MFESIQQAVIPRFNYPANTVKIEGPLPSQAREKSKTGILTKDFLARNSPGILFSAFGYNNGADCFIHIYDLATDVIPAGTIPEVVIRAIGGTHWFFDAGTAGLPMANGIVIAKSANVIGFDSTGMLADQFMSCIHCYEC